MIPARVPPASNKAATAPARASCLAHAPLLAQPSSGVQYRSCSVFACTGRLVHCDAAAAAAERASRLLKTLSWAAGRSQLSTISIRRCPLQRRLREHRVLRGRHSFRHLAVRTSWRAPIRAADRTWNVLSKLSTLHTPLPSAAAVHLPPTVATHQYRHARRIRPSPRSTTNMQKTRAHPHDARDRRVRGFRGMAASGEPDRCATITSEQYIHCFSRSSLTSSCKPTAKIDAISRPRRHRGTCASSDVRAGAIQQRPTTSAVVSPNDATPAPVRAYMLARALFFAPPPLCNACHHNGACASVAARMGPVRRRRGCPVFPPSNYSDSRVSATQRRLRGALACFV